MPGGILNSFEEGPFHVRDIALYTEQMESSVFTSPMLPEESQFAFDSEPSSEVVPPYEKDLPREANKGEEPKIPTRAPHSPTSSRKRNRDMLGRSNNDKRVTFAPPQMSGLPVVPLSDVNLEENDHKSGKHIPEQRSLLRRSDRLNKGQAASEPASRRRMSLRKKDKNHFAAAISSGNILSLIHI